MNSEQRKALQDHLDSRLGYCLDANGAQETLGEIRPDVLHTWLLLSILERLERIDESLSAMRQTKEQGRG
jgi:hypothetical protein